MGQRDLARAALATTLAVAFAACPSTAQTIYNDTVVQFAAAEVELQHLNMGQTVNSKCNLYLGSCNAAAQLSQTAAMVFSLQLPLSHLKTSEADVHISSNSLSDCALCCAGQWSCQSELWVWPIEPVQLSLWQGSIHQCQQPLPGGLTSGWLWAVLPVDL